jgi:hypothetical protein
MILHNNNNLIKQSAKCCTNCGKSYKLLTNLKKHQVLCDLLQTGKGKDKDKRSLANICLDVENEENENIPSKQKMYEIVVQLAQKCNRLEEKIAEMSRSSVSIKKKKIEVIDWLNSTSNTNVLPNLTFEHYMNSIMIDEKEACYITEVSFYDAINVIFSKILYRLKDVSPIFASSNCKANVFYVYEMINEKKQWELLTREKLVKFLNKVHIKWINVFYKWKKARLLEPGLNKQQFENIFDVANIKLMSVDFNKESVFNKVRSMLYQGLKTDLQGLVEC